MEKVKITTVTQFEIKLEDRKSLMAIVDLIDETLRHPMEEHPLEGEDEYGKFEVKLIRKSGK